MSIQISCDMYLRLGWLVLLGFNATLISWQSMTHMCFLAFSHQYLHNFSFQSHRLLFTHASAGVRGENTPEGKVASTGDRTHTHQVMSPTRSPLRASSPRTARANQAILCIAIQEGHDGPGSLTRVIFPTNEILHLCSFGSNL